MGVHGTNGVWLFGWRGGLVVGSLGRTVRFKFVSCHRLVSGKRYQDLVNICIISNVPQVNFISSSALCERLAEKRQQHVVLTSPRGLSRMVPWRGLNGSSVSFRQVRGLTESFEELNCQSCSSSVAQEPLYVSWKAYANCGVTKGSGLTYMIKYRLLSRKHILN